MTTLKITLNKEQEAALKEHADSKGKTLEEDLLDEWWGRRQALLKYKEKLELAGSGKRVEFREYHPREDRARAPKKRSKKLVITRGESVVVKPTPPPFTLGGSKLVKEAKKLAEIRILPDDSPEEACIKAEKLAERDGYATEAEILKKFGRDTRGRKVSK